MYGKLKSIKVYESEGLYAGHGNIKESRTVAQIFLKICFTSRNEVRFPPLLITVRSTQPALPIKYAQDIAGARCKSGRFGDKNFLLY